MKKIKLWLICRFWSCGLNLILRERIKEFNYDLEVNYRFFRFKYYLAEKVYKQTKWL